MDLKIRKNGEIYIIDVIIHLGNRRCDFRYNILDRRDSHSQLSPKVYIRGGRFIVGCRKTVRVCDQPLDFCRESRKSISYLLHLIPQRLESNRQLLNFVGKYRYCTIVQSVQRFRQFFQIVYIRCQI